MFEESNIDNNHNLPSFDEDLPQRDLAVEFGLYKDDQSWEEKLNNDPVERFKMILREHDKIEKEEKQFNSKLSESNPPALENGFGTYIRTKPEPKESESTFKYEATPSRLIEIPSLSAQGAKSIPELISSKVLTKTMLDNLERVRESIPYPDVGVSLHTGLLVDLDLVKQSKAPITSVDTPDITWLAERLVTAFERPSQIPNHIGWALNSSFGLTQNQAETKLKNNFEKVKELEPFNAYPFIRISVESSPRFESLLKTLSQKFPKVTLALEYDAEQMSLDQYLSFVYRLKVGNPNIGISWDPAHVYEREYLDRLGSQPTEKASIESTEYTHNVFENLTRQDQVKIFSIDYNNVAKYIKGYGETHQSVLEQGGAISNAWFTKQYVEYLNRYHMNGRMVFPETSPRQSRLLVTKDGLAYALSEIQQFISTRS